VLTLEFYSSSIFIFTTFSPAARSLAPGGGEEKKKK